MKSLHFIYSASEDKQVFRGNHMLYHTSDYLYERISHHGESWKK